MRPRNKAELLEGTHSERKKLENKVSGLSPEELVQPGSMGEWSVKDILQHLVDWEQRWIGWYQAGKRDEMVVTPEVGYNWRQMGELNEKYRQMHKDRPLKDVLEDFHASYEQILDMIEKIPEEEMLTLGIYSWTGKLPLIAWISGNTCEHYQWAIQMIHPLTIRRKMAAGNK
ncbi:MAG TPA: ClbS/DfsB family four-helix bundle protein [Anaerolineales bacterium]